MKFIVSIQWDRGANGKVWKEYGPVEATGAMQAITKVKSEIGHSFRNPAKAKEVRA